MSVEVVEGEECRVGHTSLSVDDEFAVHRNEQLGFLVRSALHVVVR